MFRWVEIAKVAVLALGTCLLGGCPGADTRQRSEHPGTSGHPGLAIIPLAPTTVSATEQLLTTITPSRNGFQVVVSTSAEFPRVEQLLARIDFDEGWSAHDLMVEQSSDGLSLSAAFPSGAHALELGVVPIGAATPVLGPGQQVLSFNLQFTGSNSKQASSAVPPVSTRARNLRLSEQDGHWTLSWDYTNPGDSNQDGQVGISDLREIGRNFRHQLSSLQQDPLRHVDADANGEINLGDVSALGANMQVGLHAYGIEQSSDGLTGFSSVGQLLLSDRRAEQLADETLHFRYDFDGQFDAAAWYRVVPLALGSQGESIKGSPSEAISAGARRLAGVSVPPGARRTVVVYAAGLAAPLSHLDACRVVFPAGYRYVPDSFNAGSPGGSRDAADGIWASFSTSLITSGEALHKPVVLSSGEQALDFNVTTANRLVLAAPVGYGDLLSFQLENADGGALDLSFDAGDPAGVMRTFYSQHLTTDQVVPHQFGNALGFRVF